MIDGILNVYKEKGYTSFDVVAKLRGILKQKKIGHTGTLDPMAEGVLLVCLGKATKLVDLLIEGDKWYEATMRLGIETDTEDITGQTTAFTEEAVWKNISHEQVKDAILSFVGEYEQIPPMYSAIKKDGKKLYEYARAGIEIERKPRHVNIYGIENITLLEDGAYRFDVKCSKGTYIRSLCRDIGRKLQCYATLSGLTRKELHGFSISQSMTLSEIEMCVKDGNAQEIILPTDSLLTMYPSYEISEKGRNYLRNGNKLSVHFFPEMGEYIEPRIRVYDEGKFVALYDYMEEEHIYRPFKMFL